VDLRPAAGGALRGRHGHTSAAPPDPARPKNAYVREDRILAHLPALHLLLTGTEPARRRRTRRGADTRPQADAQDVIGYVRDRGITLTYHPAAGTCRQAPAKPSALSATGGVVRHRRGFSLRDHGARPSRYAIQARDVWFVMAGPGGCHRDW